MMGLQSLPLPNLITKQIDRVKQDPFDDYPLEMVIYNNKIAISSSEAMSNEGISLYDKSVINYDADGKILSASHGEIKSTEYSATHKRNSTFNA
jgi:hypothetical protein